MRNSNITTTLLIENRIALKDNMEKSVILKPTKALTSKPNSKNLPRDITIGIDPAIHFYEIEDGDKTEELEEL